MQRYVLFAFKLLSEWVHSTTGRALFEHVCRSVRWRWLLSWLLLGVDMLTVVDLRSSRIPEVDRCHIGQPDAWKLPCKLGNSR